MSATTERDPDETAPSGPEEDLLFDDLDDKLAAFNAFRKSDQDAADAVLAEIGASDTVGRQIVLELASKRPLGHTERFPPAHALVMRALEVLDRNGARSVNISGLGPFGPVASFLVQQVAHFIVRSYQSQVIDTIHNLYARREAAALLGDPARPMLTRARRHTERLRAGYKQNPLGIPTFLLGGAFVSTILSSLQGALRSAGTSFVWKVVATVLVFGAFGLASWVILRGAAVARNRIRLTMDGPLQALWETVGRAGTPPQDQARMFALIAIILMGLTWLVIPIGLAIAWLTT